jgi:hypothetical protein
MKPKFFLFGCDDRRVAWHINFLINFSNSYKVGARATSNQFLASRVRYEHSIIIGEVTNSFDLNKII